MARRREGREETPERQTRNAIVRPIRTATDARPGERTTASAPIPIAAIRRPSVCGPPSRTSRAKDGISVMKGIPKKREEREAEHRVPQRRQRERRYAGLPVLLQDVRFSREPEFRHPHHEERRERPE